jgi:hypothetical protein
MDTDYDLRGRRDLLHIGWRTVADARMQAPAIIEGLDEAEIARFAPCRVSNMVSSPSSVFMLPKKLSIGALS